MRWTRRRRAERNRAHFSCWNKQRMSTAICKQQQEGSTWKQYNIIQSIWLRMRISNTHQWTTCELEQPRNIITKWIILRRRQRRWCSSKNSRNRAKPCLHDLRPTSRIPLWILVDNMTIRQETNGGSLNLQVRHHFQSTGVEGTFNRITAPSSENSPVRNSLLSRIAKGDRGCRRRPTLSSVDRYGRSHCRRTKNRGHAMVVKDNTRANIKEGAKRTIKIRTIHLNIQPLMDLSQWRGQKKTAYIKVTRPSSRRLEISSKKVPGNVIISKWLPLMGVDWRPERPSVLLVMQKEDILQQM